ncbi:MAG: hypothetical protein ACM359_23015 [Bacillota bacterium]
MRTLEERVAAMEQTVGQLQGAICFWRAMSTSLGVALVVGICIAAAEVRGPAGGSVDKLTARELILVDEQGRTVLQAGSLGKGGFLSLSNAAGQVIWQAYCDPQFGGGAMMVHNATGKESIWAIAGNERTDLIVRDPKGKLAVAAQGIDGGRLTVFGKSEKSKSVTIIPEE